MFLTALLVFVILMLAAEKHKATYIAPVGIGLALFVCELAGMHDILSAMPNLMQCQGVFFTGGSLNPTRSFGPDVVGASFPGYHYIYWIGPLLGAGLASAYYSFVKLWDYEEVNPGQDATSESEK